MSDVEYRTTTIIPAKMRIDKPTIDKTFEFFYYSNAKITEMQQKVVEERLEYLRHNDMSH